MTGFIIRILTLIFKALTFAYQTKSDDNENIDRTRTNANELLNLLELTTDESTSVHANINRSNLLHSLEIFFEKLNRISMHIYNYRANISSSVFTSTGCSKNEQHFNELNVPIYLPIETYLALIDQLLRRAL